MIFNKKNICFVLALCIAVQPIMVHASQSPRSYFPSFSSSSFSLESIKNAFNSDNLKKYVGMLVAAAGFYGLYRWIMQKPAGEAKKSADLNVNQPSVGQIEIQPDLKDPVLTDEEKKYLQENLSEFPHPLKLENNKKKLDSQNGILDVGDSSILVINSIVRELDKGSISKEDFLKALLKKSVKAFANSLASTKGGYNSLKKILIDDADKNQLKEIDWKGTALKDYCMTHFGIGEIHSTIKDQSKLSGTAFWILKAMSINTLGFNRWSADSTCKLLNLLRNNDERFKKDEALSQAIDISCTRAKIEDAQLQEQVKIQEEIRDRELDDLRKKLMLDEDIGD